MKTPRILIASGGYKHCLTAMEICTFVGGILHKNLPQCTVLQRPFSDGGEGLIDALVSAYSGTIITVPVHDSLFRLRQARLGLYSKDKVLHAVIEISEAAGSGILAPHERQSLIATSYGVGELLLAAAERGAQHIAIGLGGCISSDMGIGLAQALGFEFFDRDGNPLTPLANGGFNALSLKDIYTIKPSKWGMPSAVPKISIVADAHIPLLGPMGQVATFAQQKGISPLESEWLEEAFASFSSRLKVLNNINVDVPLAGCGGGMGAGILGMLYGELCAGAEYVYNSGNMEAVLSQSDFCITGEGTLDNSSLSGKSPWYLAKKAREWHVPIVLLVGRCQPNLNTDFCDAVVSTSAWEERLEKNDISIVYERLRKATATISHIIEETVGYE